MAMSISLSSLPLLNAGLNSTAAILLTAGYIFIRRGARTAHRNCMMAALAVSCVFLASYLYYHYSMQQLHGEAHTRFLKPAWFRPIYLTILVTHLMGAFSIVPLVFITATHALRERFDRHKRIARWTWPVWMYVSVTGVVIYFLLYVIFPQR